MATAYIYLSFQGMFWKEENLLLLIYGLAYVFDLLWLKKLSNLV